MTQLVPFKLEIEQEALDLLQQKLSLSRLPEAETPEDWSQGIPLAYIKEILEYWQTGYDCRRLEARLNEYDQYMTNMDGVDIYCLHAPSPEANALPLVMTHGWPGSIVEFLKVIEPLRNPSAFGGNPEDAFHVVCPALPGFGFSGKPQNPGWGVEKIGENWSELMRRFGYDSYVAQGGDWGSIVTCMIAQKDPEHCKAIHINMPVVTPDPETMSDLSETEQSALAGLQHYQDWDSGYSKQQSTRPQTVGYGLVDSPIGQAAWILEKFWAWTDCDGHPENVLTRDELLDNVMVYWLSASGASSARIYWESFGNLSMDPISIPVGISQFPKEIFRTSKRWAEKRFTNLNYWNELAKGGHFAAFEQPEQFVQELRVCFGQAR